MSGGVRAVSDRNVGVAIVLLLLFGGVASATTHTVCASGCDFSTIQAAVTAANSYDTVYVWNGTYTENIDIATAHLTIEGEGRDVVTVNALLSSDHVFEATVDYVNISGFTVSGATGSSMGGIYCYPFAYGRISDNNAHGNYYGIALYGTNNAIINNIVTNNLMTNLYVGLQYNYVFNNTLTNSTGLNSEGLHIYRADHSTFSNNIVRDNNDGVIIAETIHSVFSNNIIDTNKKSGIQFDGCNNNQITGNNISNHIHKWGDESPRLAHSVELLKSNNNNITNNQFGNNAFAFWIDASSDNTFSNNTINNCGRGFYLFDGDGGDAFLVDNNTITNNTISNSGCVFSDFHVGVVGCHSVGGTNTTVASNQMIHNDHTKPNLAVSVNKSVNAGELVEFTIAVNYSNGSDCTNFAHDIYTLPGETINNLSVIGNTITGDFTPTKLGFYSLVVNITDATGNTIKTSEHILISDTLLSSNKTVRYYLREINPSRSQPVGMSDHKSLLLTPPTVDEEWCCGGWIQVSPDDFTVMTPFMVESINTHTYYKNDAGATMTLDIEKPATASFYSDYDKSIPSQTTFNWQDVNFSKLEVSPMFDERWDSVDMLWFSIKLSGVGGAWKTNGSNPAWVDVVYKTTTNPDIVSASNKQIKILSATSPATDNTSASIVLGGSGTTNLTVQMPNTALTYAATYDGNPCSDAACSFTQSNGELNFSLTLGSEHTIEITEEDGDNSTYATHLSAVTPGTAGNSITTTTTCADASFGAATLTGGSDSDSEWAGSDVPTGVDIWRDGAGMIAIVVLVLLAGVVIVFLRGSGVGTGITISPNVAIGLAVGLLVLLAVFLIAPIFGDRIDSVSDLGRETHATGRLSFVLDGTTADGETVTIDATTLEFDRSADGVTAGRIPVNISDGTAATASLNLTAAINGNATLAGVVTARRDIS